MRTVLAILMIVSALTLYEARAWSGLKRREREMNLTARRLQLAERYKQPVSG